MKNLPSKIYLDLGTPDADDFSDLKQVTWSKDNASGEGIEYVRKDLMFDFLKWMDTDLKRYGAEWWFNKYLDHIESLKIKEEGK